VPEPRTTVSGAEVSVDPFGPSAEFVSVHRRRLITTILKALRRHEEADGHKPGMYKFPSATWFSLWLSDMDRLEEITTAFEQNPRLTRGLHKRTESCRLVTLCRLFRLPIPHI